MKKILSVFLLALVAVSYAGAQALNDVHIKVVADANDRVQISITKPNESTVDVVAPLTTTAQDFTLKAHESYLCHGTATFVSLDADDILINSVTYVLSDGVTTGSISKNHNGVYAISVSSDTDDRYLYEGATFTVNTTSLKETRTASIQVQIVGDDDAYQRVKITRSSDGKAVAVESNDFTIPYNPNLATPEKFTIASTSTLPLYEVKRGDDKLEFATSYTIDNLEDNLVITITPNTDITVPVTINLLEDSPVACFQFFQVNGASQDTKDWGATTTLQVPWGQSVNMQFNTAAYKVYLNDEQTSNYRINNATDENGYILNVLATEWGTFEITLEVNTPAAITYSAGSNAPQTPTATTTTLEVPENAPRVTISVVSGYAINSVKTVVGETENNLAVNYGSCTIYPAEDGMRIIVDAEEIVRDEQFVFYIDDITAIYPDYHAYIQRGDRSTYAAHTNEYNISQGAQQLVSGYNVISFSSKFDNPHLFYAPNTAYTGYGVYLNDEKQACMNYLSSSSFTLEDKDVLKTFLVAEPATHEVTFDVANGLTAPEVFRDILVPVEDLTATLSVLTGTRIDIQAAGVAVKANDIALTAENGIFSVTISEDTKITISEDQGTAISNAQAAADNNVYTLQGMLQIKNATQAQINALPAGLYIINGKTSYLLQR